MSSPKVFKNYINGKWVASNTGKTFENINPADTGDVLGVFQKSDASDVKDAVDAAAEAFKSWRLTPAPKRGEILFKVANRLLANKEKYSQDMTREMGKIIAETRGDVQEAIDMTFYMAGEGRRLFGHDDTVGTAEQVQHDYPPAARCVRLHHALELPDGHSVVEDHARSHLRQHSRDQAGD